MPKAVRARVFMSGRSHSQREAWTAFVEGREACTNKYSAIREGKYASKREAACAAQLH
jgi:hypothetical protein